jgi:predicted AAA+ superfamily ATPase
MMAHIRERAIQGQLKKRLRLWPVIGVLGPRQVGKSTLLKRLTDEGRYITLDLKQLRDEAVRAPDFFVASRREGKGLVAIDEVQKAPDLFDAIKASVDADRRPGTFILAGSTQFSTKVGIRESLTGRIGLVRLWPLTLSETCRRNPSTSVLRRLPVETSTAAEVQRRFLQGGMPGICFVRDASERRELINGWLETTCYRDMDQIVGLRIAGDKVLSVLKLIAANPDLTISECAREISVSVPTARKLIEALEILMVINRIRPWKTSSGKDRLLLCDSAIAHALGAERRVIEQVALYQEILCQYAFAGDALPTICYHQSRRGSFLDFVIEDARGLLALALVDTVSPSPYQLRCLNAFKLRNPKAKAWVVGPFSIYRDGDLEFVPWTTLL